MVTSREPKNNMATNQRVTAYTRYTPTAPSNARGLQSSVRWFCRFSKRGRLQVTDSPRRRRRSISGFDAISRFTPEVGRDGGNIHLEWIRYQKGLNENVARLAAPAPPDEFSRHGFQPHVGHVWDTVGHGGGTKRDVCSSEWEGFSNCNSSTRDGDHSWPPCCFSTPTDPSRQPGAPSPGNRTMVSSATDVVWFHGRFVSRPSRLSSRANDPW